jgi:hypothetical protein
MAEHYILNRLFLLDKGPNLSRLPPSIMNLDILNGHSRFLPIIFTFCTVKITDTYHSTFVLTRIEHYMALS